MRVDSVYISSLSYPITMISRVITHDQDARVNSIMAEHDRAVSMIEQIDQIMHALLNHNLIKEPCDRD